MVGCGLFCMFRSGWFIAAFPVLTMLYGVATLVTAFGKLQWTADLLRLKHKYLKMTQDYEAEQKRVRMEADNLREWIGQHEKTTDDLSHFMKLVEKYVDVPELTQTIVNEYIRKIVVHAPDKSSGKRRQKIQIIFNFMEDDELLSLNEPVVALSTHKKRETA